MIDIGGVWNKGLPTRSLYQYYLLIALHEKVGFHLAQDFYWYNPGALPAPAEWVNVRRIRVKCAVNLVWWLSKTPWPSADNRKVLKPYSDDMLRLLERGYRVTRRPSGHNITPKFAKHLGGAIPSNLIELGNNDSNGDYLKKCRQARLPIYPARFPRGLAEFFIKLCTEPGDVVLDPFAGSNVTGETADGLGRRWIAIELVQEYLEGSKFRFERFCLTSEKCGSFLLSLAYLMANRLRPFAVTSDYSFGVSVLSSSKWRNEGCSGLHRIPSGLRESA